MPQPNQTPDVSQFAASVLHLIQRFTGNRPDALTEIRKQVDNELQAGKEMVARAEAQLHALDQLEILISRVGETAPGLAYVRTAAPPLKKAILTVLDERPDRRWDRDELYAELVRRGWGPGGTNPRNTFTSRLRDLEKEQRLRRIGRDDFTSAKGGESD
jgi:hypothetical protein